MSRGSFKVAALLPLLLAAVAVSCPNRALAAAARADAPQPAWDRAAANYLDGRQAWWQSWPKAQRDHQTVCVSCHTAVPFAFGRPALRRQMGEQDLSAPERVMFNNIARRVTLWNEVEPFYNDKKSGPNKSTESRNTEAVLNAVILASYDARGGHLRELTRSAFANAWALQSTSGDKAGAWVWLNFHNSPWEGDESEYWGATLAALAAGIAPEGYRNTPAIQGNLRLLRSYLRREYSSQPLLNRIFVLWTSASFPGLLTPTERTSLVNAILAAQQPDGGWSLSSLGKWKRHDGTALESASDGYATGIAVLALEKNGLRSRTPVRRGVAWLLANQNRTQGLWAASSLNKQHDPDSDTGRFMSDAATGYAVLALAESRR